LPEPLPHLLCLLTETGLSHLRGVRERVACPLGRGPIARLFAQTVEVGELLAAAPELVFAALEVPEIEEGAARQEAFITQQGEDLLAEENGPEARAALLELGLLAQVLEERVVPERVEECPVQDGGGRHGVPRPEAGLELEEEAEDVLEELPEMRQKG